MDEFIIALTKKANISHSSSGYKLITSLPRELAEYLKENGAVIIVITKKDFIKYLQSSLQDQQPSVEHLEEILHKLVYDKMRRMIEEELKESLSSE